MMVMVIRISYECEIYQYLHFDRLDLGLYLVSIHVLAQRTNRHSQGTACKDLHIHTMYHTPKVHTPTSMQIYTCVAAYIPFYKKISQPTM